MIDPADIKEGAFVWSPSPSGAAYGVIDMVTEETNYARIQWRGAKRPDIISKQSPLWRHLELGT